MTQIRATNCIQKKRIKRIYYNIILMSVIRCKENAIYSKNIVYKAAISNKIFNKNIKQ
jgi:hypothetical protein